MSIRSLIEINHDFCGDLDGKLVETLQRYLRSGSREYADELDRYGIRVISQRHHSGTYYVESEPDGFPVKMVPKPKR